MFFLSPIKPIPFHSKPFIDLFIHQPPDLFRSERKVNMRNPEWGKRINYGVGDGGCGTDRSGFADTFRTERVNWRRCDRMVEFKSRQLVSLRNSVIHQFSGQQLTVLVIDYLFKKRLRHSLRDAAMNLPLDNHRVDLIPAIINRDITIDRYLTCVLINLYNTDMRPIWERKIFRLEEVGCRQPRFEIFRDTGCGMSRQRDLLNRHAFIIRCLDEFTVFECKARLVSPEQV